MVKKYNLKNKMKFKISPLEIERESIFRKFNAICLGCEFYLLYGLCSHKLIEPGLDESIPRFIPNKIVKERKCKYFIESK